jgi:hypothetical protein
MHVQPDADHHSGGCVVVELGRIRRAVVVVMRVGITIRAMVCLRPARVSNASPPSMYGRTTFVGIRYLPSTGNSQASPVVLVLVTTSTAVPTEE